ncbi:MAG: Gfo/Idh/MocA family oxidoreductase [bacterium]|jgi:predicted dehydrogenase|nr:Gfo/Idh/MocA family oxidoreductase [bacterium]
MTEKKQTIFDRRNFVKTSIAGAGLVLAKPKTVFSLEANSALQCGLIGCGGRGNNDASKFIRYTNCQMVALADMFADRLEATQKSLNGRLAEMERAEIDSAKLFQGMNSYQELLALSELDMVIITSPPYYHPLHLETAVDAGKHVYMEKPVATDVAGAKRVIKAGLKAMGKQSLGVGFQIRYAEGYAELAKRIHNGDIGQIVHGHVFYHAGRLGSQSRPDESPLQSRLRNWVFDKELSGDIIVEQNIHVIDVANWFLQSHPLKAYGTGGRKGRTDVGDCWDHFICTYYYPDGSKMDFSSSQFLNGWGDCRNRLFGTKGVAQVSYSDVPEITGENAWKGEGGGLSDSAEPNKVTAFEQSIRSGNFINEAQQGAESTLTSILGRMAAYSESEITWDEMLESNQEYNPGINL